MKQNGNKQFYENIGYERFVRKKIELYLWNMGINYDTKHQKQPKQRLALVKKIVPCK
jgi:hypothetical protein